MTPVTIQDVRVAGGNPDLGEALEALRRGEVLLYPTETVYGLGSSLAPEAIARVQRIKDRGAGKPLLILVPGPEAVAKLEWTAPARELASVFWPGALTLVLSDPGGAFPAGVRSPGGTVAVRQTPHPVAAALVDGLGAPLTSTSANSPGEAPARTAGEARAVAASADPSIPIHLLDAGDLPPSDPSTLVDCSGPRPVILREGAIPASRIRCVLPELESRG